MSSSMSPPPQRPQGSSYPPLFQGNGSSPVNAPTYGQPPAKRQRLSPDARSPPNAAAGGYGSPQTAPQGAPVTSAYGNPYATFQPHAVQSPQSYAASPQSSFHTPQPYPFQQMPWQSQPGTPAAGQASSPATANRGSPPSQLSREMMPPPPRPNREEREEKVGVEEIGDSLFGSGINLKDEENYLQNVYNNRHGADNLTPSLSFGSTTLSGGGSFNMLTQETSFGSEDTNGAMAGTLGPARSQDDIELEERKAREAAAKARAERKQHHLNNPFLLCNNVRMRMNRAARNNGVSINTTGWASRPTQRNVMVNGMATEGLTSINEKVQDVKLEERTVNTVTQGAPFEHVLALLSLATGERVRELLDESFSLARSRRYGDRGRVVPPEFSDLAEGEGMQRSDEVIPESITNSQWDKIPDSLNKEGGLPNGDDSKRDTPQSQTTIGFQGTLSATLREVAERDLRAEKERARRREARRRTGDNAVNGDASTTDATGESSTPNAPSEAAAPVKISKKEQAKQQKEKFNNEAQANNTVNQTAAMMALGRKGNRYSWMSGGAANLPTNRFAKPATSGTATPSGVKQEAQSPAASGEATSGKSGAGGSTEAQLGEFKEDGLDGKGIQLRDWILVLERDGREKLALQKAFLKM